MNHEVLEKVLACQKLPSLPAVAMRVVELTSDKNVNIKELAATITNDQGLSSKVLRTVNSSFYALRKPCGSINQAIVMLGLSAVKTLALGFSLVSSIANLDGKDFDLQTYWRRSLLSGIGAKCFAAEAKIGNDEECFLGGLLQDVGVVAMCMALGPDYLQAVAPAGDDHHQVAKLELAAFEVAHPDIGAMLAGRWKLPPELVMPVKYHERPTAAPQEYAKIVQAVALGNIAADVVSSAEPALPLKRLYTRAEQWLALKPAQVDEALKRLTQGAKEVARLLGVDAGAMPSSEDILARAGAQMREVVVPVAADPPPAGDAAPQPANIDELTGLPDRLAFNRNLVATFEVASNQSAPLSVALLRLDQHEALTNRGQAHADAGVVAVAAIISAAFKGTPAVICRYLDDCFAVLLPGVERADTLRHIENARALVSRETIALSVPGMLPEPTTLTICVGAATFDQISKARFPDADTFLTVTEQALIAAARAGGNTMRVYTPKAA